MTSYLYRALLVALLLPSLTFAQENDAKERFSTLRDIARPLFRPKPDSAFLLLNQMEAIAEETQDSNYFQVVYFEMSIFYAYNEQSRDSMIALCKRSERYTAPENYSVRAKLYEIMGEGYEMSGRIEQAEEVRREWLRYAQLANDTMSMVRSLGKIGALYSQQGQFKEALEITQQSQVIWDAFTNEEERIDNADPKRAFAQIYAEYGDFDRSIEYIKYVLDGLVEGEEYFMAIQWSNNLGDSYFA